MAKKKAPAKQIPAAKPPKPKLDFGAMSVKDCTIGFLGVLDEIETIEKDLICLRGCAAALVNRLCELVLASPFHDKK